MSDETKSESVYERAFAALHDACANGRLKMSVPVDEQHDHDCLIIAGLTASEAAEKRAEAAEVRVRELEIQNSRGHQLLREAQENVLHMTNTIGAAILLLNPARPEDGLLPAIRDVMQRLTLAEAGRSDDDYQDR